MPPRSAVRSLDNAAQFGQSARVLDAAEATAAVAISLPGIAIDLRAERLGGTDMWSVAVLDEHGRPEAGSFLIVGPDRRVWSFSSNPSIHDPQLVVDVLAGLYREQLAEQVDANLLGARIAQLTVERADQARGVLTAAGELRRQSPRTLP